MDARAPHRVPAPKPQDALKQCAEIEDVIGRIYRRLADAFAHDESLCRFFSQMADEEEGHRRQIEMAQRLSREGVAGGSRISAGELEQLGRRAKTLLAGVRTSALSVQDALRASVRLEEDGLKVHAARAVDFREDGAKKVFSALAEADAVHVARLKEVLGRYGRVPAAARP